MKINCFVIALTIAITLLQESFAKRILQLTDLVGTIVPPTKWSIERIKTNCNQTIESEKGVMQLQKGESSKKKYSSLPPHWNIQVDASVYLVGTWEQNNLAQFYIDGGLVEQTVQSFPHSTIKVDRYRYVEPLCQDIRIYNNDGYVQWSHNMSHIKTDVELMFKNDLDPSSSAKAYSAFNNIRIFLDLCDETCLTCSGPTQDQCLSCPTGSTLMGTKCQCDGTTVALNFQCIASCPTGQWADPNMKKCVPKCTPGQNYCSDCLDERSCSKCTGGYALLNGDCISQCPRRYDFDSSSSECIKVEDRWKRGKFLYGGLNSDINNDDKLIDQRDFDAFEWNLKHNTTTNPLSQYYVCKGGERMMGGYQISGDGAITKKFTNIPYHWRARVKVKLWQIDSWNNEQLQVETDGIVNCQQTHWFDKCSECDNFCGYSGTFVDKVGSCDTTFNHSGDSLVVNFRFFADQDTWNESLAISDLYIIIDECPNQLCTKCDELKCYECVKGAYLLNDLCVNPCPDGMYGDDVTKKCEKCNIVCQTCVTSPGNCIICSDVRLGAVPPKCDCPDGKYDNPPINYMCLPCNYECQTCQTSGSNCTDCAKNRPDIGKPKCNCPSGTYDQGDPEAFCPNCIYRCLECEKTERTCTKCAGTNRLTPPQCKCADGFYDDGKSPDCQPCFKFCRTCEGSADNCIDCVSNRVAPKCNCDEFTFDDGSLTCKPCSFQCKTCTTNSRNCLTCAGNRLKNPPDCPCPPGYNEAGYPSCIECIYKCKECTSDKTNCTTCAENRLQQPPLCPCPDGTFENYLALCPNCSYRCATCEKNAENCIKCSHPSRGNPPLCACLDGYYDDGKSPECKKCDSKCVGCTENSTKCITCGKNRVLPNCNCQDGFYEDALGTCQKCHPNCYRCKGPGPNECDTCSDNRLDYPNCTCPPGTYDDGTPSCKPCNAVCKQCTGPEVYQCKECAGNKAYNPATQRCDCKQGTFDAGPNTYCPDCAKQCLSCLGNSLNCTQCKSNRTLDSQCTSCVTGFYDNGKDADCQKCNQTKCLTCSSTPDNCQICQPNRINPPACGCKIGMFALKNGDCASCSPQCGSCVDNPYNCLTCAPRRDTPPTCSCPAMQYQDPQTKECLRCNPNCLECVESAVCTVCKPGRTSFPYCLCPNGQYYRETNQDCYNCDFQCLGCYLGSSKCTQCRGNRVNLPQCTCPVGTYEAFEDDCRQCLSKCGDCSGNEGNCTSCAEGRENYPDCSCKQGTYEDRSSGICNKCFPTCQSCFGEGQYSCYKCQPGLIYVNGECRAQDQFFYNPATQLVERCDPRCGGCEFDKSNCFKCNSLQNRVLVNNKCLCLGGYEEVNDVHQPDNYVCQFILSRPTQCNQKNSGIGVLYLKECDCNENEFYNVQKKLCMKCTIPFCQTCISDTQCGQCNPSSVLVADGLCSLEVTDQSSQNVLVALIFVVFGFGIAIWLPLAVRKVYLRFFQKNPILKNTAPKESTNFKTNASSKMDQTVIKTRNSSAQNNNRTKSYKFNTSQHHLQYDENSSSQHIDFQ